MIKSQLTTSIYQQAHAQPREQLITVLDYAVPTNQWWAKLNRDSIPLPFYSHDLIYSTIWFKHCMKNKHIAGTTRLKYSTNSRPWNKEKIKYEEQT